MSQQFQRTKLAMLNEKQTKQILQNSFPKVFTTSSLENMGDLDGNILLSLTERELKDDFEIKSKDARLAFLKLIEHYKRNGVPMMGNKVVREDEVSPHNYHPKL